jgi:hypothetical protein
VKAGKVNQDTDVWPLVKKATLSLPGQINEPVNVEQHPQEPHHRQCRHVGNQGAAGLGHLRATQTNTDRLWAASLNGSAQEGRMMITRGFTRRKKYSHD